MNCRLLALLLSASLVVGSQWPHDDDNSPAAALARWMVDMGAELNGVRVGRECPDCMRGVLATRDFEDDDVIMLLPYGTMLAFTEGLDHSSRLAREWLHRMHTEPGFNDTWALYWATQPPPGEAFVPEVYTDEHLAALQTPELEGLTRHHREVAHAVYHGTDEAAGGAAEERVPPGIALDTFLHVSALVHSRSFTLPRGAAGGPVGHMVPLLELLNHGDDPNTWWQPGEDALVLRARGRVSAGRELTHNYIHAVAHRPDMSLFSFGFVVAHDPPLLASVDLPGYSDSRAFQQTPLDDSQFDDPGGEAVTAEQYDRLAERLAACATSEAEDRTVLASGMVTDPRLHTLLEYRVQRKWAMRVVLGKIAAHLGWGEAEQQARLAAAADRARLAAAAGSAEVDDGGGGDGRSEL